MADKMSFWKVLASILIKPFAQIHRLMSNNDIKEEKDEIKEEVQAEGQEVENTSEKAEPSVEDQIKELNDKYMRLYSEFENFRRRTSKEKIELIQTAGADLIKELLPVLDDMERAMESNAKSEDIEAIKEGFQLVHNKFNKILVSKGLQVKEDKGEVFDADVHEAIAKIPAPEENLKGKVVDVVEKGYALNDKVLRYSKVVVGE